ncbi:MAG TPA: TlpA disulfide reductase family protein [Acetobacteraceae bacterium]|nr:TlpA disulfide reductase family protein [Acetobacteraceae bacterium]
MRAEVWRRSVLLALAGAAIGLGAAGLASAWRPAAHPREIVLSNAPPKPDGGISPGFAFPAEPRPVPDLRFVDGAGRGHSLAELRGHSLVLNIWATWCVPCRKEMPTLDRLQATLAGSDALVVPLSIDSKGPPVVKSFYQEIGIKSLGIYVDASGAASRELGVVGIPTTLLVDRDGREAGRRVGPADWNSPEIVNLIRDHLGPKPVAAGSGQRE